MAKKNQQQQAESDQNLQGFSIRINEFGQVETTMGIDRVNAFLNENVDDKKFRDKKEKDEAAVEDAAEDAAE